MEEERNVKHLGQVFTPENTVNVMLSLRKNKGSVLEPSCGAGAFSDNIPGCIAIEYDKNVAPSYAKVMDFFDYGEENKFDTIVGNPPYVRYKDIPPDTKKKLNMSIFDERSNLYLFFIEKCIRHLNPRGELIFIVPREIMRSTAAARLNERLYSEGTITDLIDLSDKKIFQDAAPDTVIFRFEKGNFKREMKDGRTFSVINGQMIFSKEKYTVPFSELFFVKVGAVSGADRIFTSKNGNLELVGSTTRTTGELKRMYYNTPAPDLLKHKDELLARRVKKFDEDTWYMWGRGYYESETERLYVNAKTRQSAPFFYNQCKAYDGSVLAIFPKFKADKELLLKAADDLNAVDWTELGFKAGGRFLFSQRALENTVLPEAFGKYRSLL